MLPENFMAPLYGAAGLRSLQAEPPRLRHSSMECLQSRFTWTFPEATWGATGSELSVRRRTNSIRRGCCDEPAHVGRSPKIAGHAGVVVSDDRAAPRGWRRNDKKV